MQIGRGLDSKKLGAARQQGFSNYPGLRFIRKMARSKLEAPQVCPVCGEDVPRGSLACPECGADHNSGWRPGADLHDGLDLPEEQFDYDEFVRREFGSGAKPAGIRPIWWVTAIILLALSILYFFRG
jgi:hypothetical protein